MKEKYIMFIFRFSDYIYKQSNHSLIMRSKLEVDFHYLGNWVFTLLVIFISLTLGYHSLSSEKNIDTKVTKNIGL